MCSLIAVTAAAQTIGNQTFRTTTSLTSSDPNLAFTLFDFSHPAATAGQINTVTFRWDKESCTNAAKIKFLRRTNPALGTFTIIERGPFNVTSTVNTVTLNPPVDVQPGDYIGITELRGQSRGPCGATPLAESTRDQILLVADGDVQSGSFSSLRPLHGYEMNVLGSFGSEVLAAVIPAAGAAAGQNNSFFRTSVQLTNVLGTTITGKIVYHPAGQQASAADPSIPFTLHGFETKANADIVTALGRAGLGSIDIVTTASVPPVVSARVYNDQGAAGTSGFTEEAFRPSEALRASEEGVLQVPADLTKFRLNVGVRTLGQGATLQIGTHGANGTDFFETTKSYPPNYFIQVSGADFAGQPLTAASSIVIKVTAGSAFVYGSTTENKTNDSSVQFATRH